MRPYRLGSTAYRAVANYVLHVYLTAQQLTSHHSPCDRHNASGKARRMLPEMHRSLPASNARSSGKPIRSEVHSPWKIRADVETGRKIRLSLLIDSSEAIAASQ